MNEFDDAIRAVYRKDYDSLSTYLEAGIASSVDEDGRTLLMHAILASDADADMVQFLIDHGVPVNTVDGGQKWTALHFAARDKRSDIIEILLGAGADVDAVETFGNTPLARSLDALPYDGRTIQLLLDAGADPNKKNKHGVSTIDAARNMGNERLLALLSSGG